MAVSASSHFTVMRLTSQRIFIQIEDVILIFLEYNVKHYVNHYTAH